jgi:hypothetical protein
MSYTPLNPHAGFYAYNKSILFNIVTASVYHPLYQVTAGDFTAGSLTYIGYREGLWDLYRNFSHTPS